MVTGHGHLILRGGREIDVEYQFGSDHDETRVGYLIFDVRGLDPAVLAEILHLRCEDGSHVRIAVSHASDRHLGVVGRQLAKPLSYNF